MVVVGGGGASPKAGTMNVAAAPMNVPNTKNNVRILSSFRRRASSGSVVGISSSFLMAFISLFTTQPLVSFRIVGKSMEMPLPIYTTSCFAWVTISLR